jgi:MFS family permease
MSVVNQLLFILLYVIPLSGFEAPVKTAAFVVCIMLAYVVYNMVHPKKINWYMSQISDSIRGSFTAKKEAVSLLAGMAFQFSMGAVVDAFVDQGKTKTAFIISAVVLLVIMIIHTLVMIVSPEKEVETERKQSVISSVKDVFSNKNILKVAVVLIMYQSFNSMCVAYSGVYMINDLGFSLKYVSVLAIVSAFSRILLSFMWGKFADRQSFAKMTEKSLLVLALSYVFLAFATPTNGRVMVLLYYIAHGVALGGMNSALTNLVYDYASLEKRADSLAICQAASGVSGFLITLLVSPLVALIQANGNSLFGINIYAQQLLAGLSVVGLVLAAVYVRLVLVKKQQNKNKV